MPETNQAYAQPELQPLKVEKPAKPRWRRVLKWIFGSLGIFIGFILLSAILIPLLFEDQVKRLFINELNKNLATAVVVNEDDIRLTILKNFPDASIVFKNIGITESFPGSKNKFLEAGELSLVFNVWDILHKKYVIDEINVKDGYCHLISDKRGNINYKIWKDSESPSTSDFNINLQKVLCSNMEFSYRDFKYKEDIALTLHDVDFTGNFSSDHYVMAVTGNIFSKRIHIGGTDYLAEHETKVNSSITVDVPHDKYTFSDASVEVDKNNFLISGAITLEGKNYYDLTIEGDEINLPALALLLPGSASKKFNSLESSGDLNFKSTIKGYSTSTETPLVEIKFDVHNATVNHAKFGGKLTDVSLSGVYSNGEKHNAQTSYISISNFSGKQKNEPIIFSLDYRNFKNPSIKLKLDGNLPAALLIPFAFPEATNVNGMIGLRNINVNGNVKSFDYNSSMPSGEIQFNDLSFENNGENISIPTGNAIINNNQIKLENIAADLAGSDVILNLEVNNWIQNVFPSELKPALIVNGTLQSKKIDLNKLLAAFGSSTEEEPGEKQPAAENETDDETILNFNGSIATQVEEISYDQLRFANISTTVKLTPGMVAINDLHCSTMNGQCNLNATFREIGGKLILETSGTLNSIDIGTMFDQFENFDQSTLTSKNIKGSLTANIYQLSITWDKNYALLENMVYTKMNMKIENGELIDYKPLETLSGFVNVKDLRDIHFSTLENEIEIKDRWIYIPAMKIESSALDLYMSGKHSFSNEIDYQFKLSMADVLVRKFLGGNKKNENYEEDAEGGVNVYVLMTGTVEHPVISYNKKEAKQKLQESGLEEQKFIDIFKPDPDTKMFKKPDPEIKKDTSDEEQIEFIEFDDE